MIVSVAAVGVNLLSSAAGWAANANRDWEICLDRKSALDDVIATCTRALAQPNLAGSDRASAYNRRALAYRNKRELERAISDLNEAIRLDPAGPTHHANRGLVHIDRRDYERAVRDYSEAIRLSPTSSTFHRDRGIAHGRMRAHQPAIHDLDQAIRLDAKDVLSLVWRGFVLMQSGDTAGAIRDFDEAIKLNPQQAAALANRGDSYRQRGDLERSLSDLNEAIRLEPNRTPAYTVRGLVHDTKGERDRAIADFKFALSLPVGGFANGEWAHATARERLAALTSGAQASLQPPHAQSQPQTGAPLGKRVALVVGNSNYPGRARLSNPVNDADDVAEALTKVGFEVVKGRDLSLSGFGETIAAFRDKAAGADVALFYYAGHGMQFDDQNWLLPVDTKARTLFEARRQFVPLTEAIAEVEARAGTTLVFLDSCRDNPLEEELKASFKAQGRSYGDSRGLARLDIKSPQTLVVYATRPNTTAADGHGRNSPFTEALLQHIATPGVEIEVLMKRVSAAVAAKTRGKQQPERLSRLENEFYFVPAR